MDDSLASEHCVSLLYGCNEDHNLKNKYCIQYELKPVKMCVRGSGECRFKAFSHRLHLASLAGHTVGNF